MKIALAMIVKPTDEEADLLARCLKYTAPHVDGVFLTITGENEKCERVAKLFNANVSHYAWDKHFANARNYNFAQVPKEYDYILWLDCDDVPRGIEKLRGIMEKHVSDVYTFNYLYSFDEFNNPVVVHMKSRVIKNDGCVSWVGVLHEDFKENRSLTRHLVKDIDVLHLSTEDRFEAAKKRNVDVAKYDMSLNPNDPRSFWNLGNSLKADGNNLEAIECFEKFFEMSHSDDEKYIIRLRVAESYWALGNFNKAIENARMGIGIKPEYPDAYHLAGYIYYDFKAFEKAKDMFLLGLVKPVPYYSIIVYNPRDYDYNPLMALAKTYFQLGLPTLALPCLKGCLKINPKDVRTKNLVKEIEGEAKKFEKAAVHIEKLKKITDKEKLKKAMDKIPEELQSHPAICLLRNENFIKQETSGKDMVIFCGQTIEAWTPETAITKGIGGSEEAVIHLSRELTKLGWNVTVYNNCGHKPLSFDGVTYKPWWMWNHRDAQDVTIVWRTPRFVDYKINSKKIIVDLHDVVPEGEFNEDRLKKIDKIFVKSEAHRILYPNIPDEKFAIIPNGIVVSDFSEPEERDNNLIINTSSPDRSVNALIDCFKEIKKVRPEAKCKWAYGWNVFDSLHKDDPKMLEWKREVQAKLKDAGIEELGRLGHKEVAKLYKQAGILLYPTEFYEIDCISVRKAQAAGCFPITTDFAALKTTNMNGVKVKSDKNKDNWVAPYQFDYALTDSQKKLEMVEHVRIALGQGLEENREQMIDWAKQFDWSEVAKSWNENL